MGFEIPLDVDYFHHPKTKHLIGLLGRRADIFPPRLWAWCCKYSRDGAIKGGAAQLEAAVDWDGEPGALFNALIATGFLEKNGKRVHDFMEHSGRAILLYEQKKRKQREKYSAGILPEEFQEGPKGKRKNSAYPGNPGEERRGDSDSPPKSAGREKTKTQEERRAEIDERIKAAKEGRS